MKYFGAAVLLTIMSSFYVTAQMPKIKQTGLELNQQIPELKVNDVNG